jgi:hypothetical protein
MFNSPTQPTSSNYPISESTKESTREPTAQHAVPTRFAQSAQRSAIGMSSHAPHLPHPSLAQTLMSRGGPSSSSLASMWQTRQSQTETQQGTRHGTEQHINALFEATPVPYSGSARYPLIHIQVDTPSRRVKSSRQITQMLREVMKAIRNDQIEAKYKVSEITFFGHQFYLAKQLDNSNPELKNLWSQLSLEEKSQIHLINNSTGRGEPSAVSTAERRDAAKRKAPH